MKMMRRFFVTMLFCLSICAVGVHGQTPRGNRANSVRLVPAGSIAVLRIDWAAARNDAHLRRAVRGEELERLLGGFHLQSREVAQLIVFTDITMQATPRAGMILDGSFNSRAVVERLRAAGWREESHRGHALYAAQGEADSWLAPLRAGALACGTRRAVEAVIGAEANPRQALLTTQPFARIHAQAGGHRFPVTMILAFPAHYQAAGNAALRVSSLLMSFAGLGPVGELFNRVGFAQAMSFSISRAGDTAPMRLVAIMRDAEAATLVSGSLGLFQGLSNFVPQRATESASEQRMRAAFQNMTVARTREILAINIAVPVESLPR